MSWTQSNQPKTFRLFTQLSHIIIVSTVMFQMAFNWFSYLGPVIIMQKFTSDQEHVRDKSKTKQNKNYEHFGCL